MHRRSAGRPKQSAKRILGTSTSPSPSTMGTISSPRCSSSSKQYDARCTTFLLGTWAASHKREVKRMHRAGFEIANHTWSHPFLTRMSSSQVESELTRTQRVITSITGNQAPYMRPPYGDTDASVRRTAAGLGYRVVLWNRSFGDSGRGATAKKLYQNVMTRHGGIKSGDIILCHWGSKGTYGALKRILPELKASGIRVCDGLRADQGLQVEVEHVRRRWATRERRTLFSSKIALSTPASALPL